MSTPIWGLGEQLSEVSLLAGPGPHRRNASFLCQSHSSRESSSYICPLVMWLLANLKKLDDSKFLVCLFCPNVSYKPQQQVEGDCSHKACPWPGHHGPVARTQNEGLRVAFSPNLVAFLDSFVAFLDTAKLLWSEKSDWWPVSPIWKSCNQFSLCIWWVYIWCVGERCKCGEKGKKKRCVSWK